MLTDFWWLYFLKKRALERSRKRWIDDIKIGLKKVMRMEGGWNWLRTMSSFGDISDATRPSA
jgi:hypothetical protein